MFGEAIALERKNNGKDNGPIAEDSQTYQDLGVKLFKKQGARLRDEEI